MSIKEEVENLREKQRQLEAEIKKEELKRNSEIRSKEKIEEKLNELKDKKSKLAKKIYEEYSRDNEEYKWKIKKIEKKIEKFRNEYLPIKSRIDKLNSDKSFYINEQVSYLISELMSYVEKNEMKLGKNISTHFSITPCRAVDYKNCYVLNGYFEIKQDKEIVVKTKDYYFENKTWWMLDDKGKKYITDFIKSFVESLKKDFYSENFKIVVVNEYLGEFVIELN